VKKKNKIISSKSERVVRKNLSELRKIIDETNDIIEARVAQCLETGITWATQETEGWDNMWDETVLMTKIIKQEIADEVYKNIIKVFDNE